jgi:small subunit ribosomal protein S20
MPILASSKKALRKDLRRRQVNLRIKNKLKAATDSLAKTASNVNLNQAYQIIDRAAKKNVMHPNKANRLKSRMAKSLKPQKITKIKPLKSKIPKKPAKKTRTRKK